ncbi:hypothetical protein M404DRAFT_1007245 [Pisolithus tinctorius Marx 270]|uniref:Uncharacterized protein n=1 Tax=Pisolithus tinctorius Marx 270 TaxID=870435 RepID=A0A0C3IFD5_PISTI|nr:hypothetical protein M404DRAFT_1007245 [Pisolithus tinctorius Marx 270]
MTLPYPFHFPLPAPLSPMIVLCNPSIVQQRMDDTGLPEIRYTLPFCACDTPLRCLHRIYERAAIG